MKKVKLLKDHLGISAGSEVAFKAGVADYLVKMGVAENIVEPEPKEVKNPKKKKKSK